MKKSVFHKIKVKAGIIWRILFRKNAFLVVYFSKDDLVNIIVNDRLSSSEIDISYCGCMEHHALRVIKEAGNMIDETELICEKASFDIDVATILKGNPENPYG